MSTSVDTEPASGAKSQMQAPSAAAAASSEETNNNISNNNNNNINSLNTNSADDDDDSKPGQRRASGTGGGLASTKKRASMQSSSSVASANGAHAGGGHSSLANTNTSGSSNQATEDDDDDNEGGRVKMSNAEYEHIRNKTLLFFLDRLYLASQEGKEARTLHDLSCLFGTREFTKEMRQIVGASRNGLKKFLQSYPSLFQIEDDKVHLTQLKESTQVAQRDYNKEAVEYFKQKLLQFGSSLVPIKNLFGYRSQASQEVRHVSGKNSRDFKRFLKQNEDVFEILADEHVVLKSALKELESQGLSSLSLQQSLQPVPAEEATTMDPYLNKQLAHLIEDYIKEMIAEQEPPIEEPSQFRVSLEVLHDRVHKRCQNEIFLKMVKTLEDLRVFLRMHPKLFKRFPANSSNNNIKQDSNNFVVNEDESLTVFAAGCYVGLLSDSERRELESQAFQASNPIQQRQHSTLDQLHQLQQTTKLTTCSTTPTKEAIQTTTTTTATTTTAPATTTTNDNKLDSSSRKKQSQQPASLPPEASSNTAATKSTSIVQGEQARERSKPMRGDKVVTTTTNSDQRQTSNGAMNKSGAPAAGGAKSSNRRSESSSQDGVGINAKQQKQPLKASRSNDRGGGSQVPNNNQSASQKLRANAPPFVPSRPQANNQQHQHNHHHHQQQQQVIHRQNSLLTQAYRPSAQNMGANTTNNRQQRQVPAPIQRSVSNLNPPMMGAAGQPNRLEQEASQDKGSYHRRQMDMPPYDRRAAIRSYLMKGSGTGGSSNQHNMNWGHQQQQQQHQQQHAFRGNAPPPPSAHPNATGKSQDLPRQRVVAQQQWTSPAPSSIERNNTAQAAAGQTPATAASQEDLRARTVDIVREASNIIAKIMSTTDAVAFDCKGYNLGFDGKITLIQFGFLPTKQVDPMQLANSMNKRFALSAPTSASPAHHHHHQSSSDQQTNNQDNGGDNENGDQQANKENNDSSTTKKHLKPEVCVFDLITNPELAYCLKPLLESDKIVKIVHDVRNKSNALHVQFNIILNNVFDTQVANLVIQQQVTGKPAYKSRYISMGKLCEIYGSDDLVRYRDMIKFKTSGRGGGSGNSSNKDVNYWRSRPLTRSMILEATMDVYCLVGGIYQNLKESIKPEYKPLFDLLNLEGVLARIKPEEIRSAKKERKIDMEVIDLKRKLYSDTTGPVVLSNREIRLLRHIDLTEGVRQKIQQCKKVAKKLERLDMKAALLRQQQLEQSDGTAAEGGEDGRQQQLTSLNSQLSSLNSHSNNSSLGAVGGANGSGLSKEEEQRQEQLRARLEEFNAAVAMMDDNSMFDELKDRLNESTSLLESLENDDDDDEERDEEAQLSSGHHSHNGSSINDCCRCQCHSHSHSNSNSLSNSHSQQQSSLESGAGAARSQGGGQPGEVVKPPELIGATVQTDETTEAKKGEPVNSNNSECRPQTKLTHHDVQDETSAKEESQAQKKEEAEAHKEDSSKPSDLNSSDNNTLPQGQAKGTQGEQESSGKEEPCGDDESDDSKSSACDMAVQCDLLS
uniref:3'-5' exonuclease domain-containing protein n=1 Tax=Aceria tosichella TaxID=561515 RepID=A0A6G1SP15_9ACAR